MRRIARVCFIIPMGLAVAVSMAADKTSEVLPTGLGNNVDRGVEQLRKATTPFRSVDGALAAGYTQETECVERPPEGAMGYHFTKADLRDGVLELQKPEVLVYGKRADGFFQTERCRIHRAHRRVEEKRAAHRHGPAAEALR